ncbi:hypothetical protein CQA49_08165, partial [Helicobacter sp. MIT 00-7814]
ANVGAISSESPMAIGFGGARAAQAKNTSQAISSANSYMDKFGGFSSNSVYTLRNEMDMARDAYRSAMNTPHAAASKANWMNAKKAYDNALRTQNSMQRHYNALSPQAKDMVLQQMGGSNGGIVTKNINQQNIDIY